MKINKIMIVFIFSLCLGKFSYVNASIIKDQFLEPILGNTSSNSVSKIVTVFSCGIQDPSIQKKGHWGMQTVNWEFASKEPMSKNGKGPHTPNIRLNSADQVKPDKDGNFIAKLGDPSFRGPSVFANVLRAYEMIDADLNFLETQYPRNSLLQDRIKKWRTHNGYKPLMITPVDNSDENNAFYNRDADGSRALSFFPIAGSKGKSYTADSSDIVMHEAGHSILDILFPEFFDGFTGHTGAIHEAFGDLIATWCTLCHWPSVGFIADQTGMDLGKASILSNVAEEFGQLLEIGNGLRDLDHDTNLEQTGSEVHDASLVLSGAIYDIMKSGVSYITSRNLETYRNKRPKIIYDVSEYMRRSFIQALITSNISTFEDIGKSLLNVVENHSASFAKEMTIIPWEKFIREEFEIRDIMGADAVKKLEEFKKGFSLKPIEQRRMCQLYPGKAGAVRCSTSTEDESNEVKMQVSEEKNEQKADA